jgi:very-short-patch-repair endonuclease
MSPASDQTPLDQVLDRSRQNLLDLSLRNRLISTPRGANRSSRLEIVDERADEVFRILVREQKAMTFLPSAPGPGDAESSLELFAPVDEGAAEGEEIAERHRDTRLQTQLTSEQLQSRLLSLYYDARTSEEEQGVSILYLALGFLEWYDSPSSDQPRFAPLLLIPVDLERPSVTSRFKLKYRDSEISTNLSLLAKLQQDFGVSLPDVPDTEDLQPTNYFSDIEKLIAAQSRWQVRRNDMVLWFFSFAKYLMYRDLDPENWPEHAPLTTNPMINKALIEGFKTEPPICGDDDKIDAVIDPNQAMHVTDADSSQALVIEEVRRGRNLVVQGPPGTGKSQTITNLIATAIKDGKKVLFVAEKMAALEVVKRRLDGLDLGALCLELHSNKANKKVVLAELDRTLKLGRPKAENVGESVEALVNARDRLNRHAEVLNTRLDPAGVTPHEVIGQLVRHYVGEAQAVRFRLPDAVRWSKKEYQERCGRLQNLQSFLKELGSPATHPWRGVERTESLLPTDRSTLMGQVDWVLASLAKVSSVGNKLAGLLHIRSQDANTLHTLHILADLGRRLVTAPPMDRAAMASSVWETQREQITELVRRGSEMAATRAELDNIVSDAAWEADLETVRQGLTRGWWVFRFLSRDYRNATKSLRGLSKAPLPKSNLDRLKLVDSILGCRSTRKWLEDARQALGADAFGSFWQGPGSDWPALDRIMKWEEACRGARLPKRFREISARIRNPEALSEPTTLLGECLPELLSQLTSVFQELSFNSSVAFGAKDLHVVALDELNSRLQAWQAAPEALARWINFRLRKSEIEQDGLIELIALIEKGETPAEAVGSQFRQAYHEALIRHCFAKHPELMKFDGMSYATIVEEFRRLDKRRIGLARQEVALAHFVQIPREGDLGEMAVIYREIAKKRRHLPIRKLLQEAGHALQAIKPVFMMSPISIAQFLAPGTLEFDLMVMDEASQVTPEDALGAMARAKQIVVVGDSKQLPPTGFFKKMLSDETLGEDDEVVNTGDLESILKLCESKGVPQRMLRWHYRSRHHSLIAVSNREFYGNELCVIPSPQSISPDHGLRFRFVGDGVFDRGGKASNQPEARAVAQAVIEHARRSPEKSLGVGTFSVAQRDAVLQEVELLRRGNADLEKFFAQGNSESGGSEPFFVKNLENIQGDERDVIFISVGYGKDKSGALFMNFGPLSNDGGERRLNVLISRARERCEVFSSITSDDIDTARAKSVGVRAFKHFLRFAKTGILEDQAPTGAGFDSEFERQVCSALQQHGYEVHPQVGTAGFRIDLAVVDADHPGRYLLGIECDGATYHSARWARDRDRLREQVLKDRGWTIHRIWSTDWFHRPKEQVAKTVAAIDAARAGLAAQDREEKDPEPPKPAQAIERAETTAADQTPENTAKPYIEASFAVPKETSIHDLPINKLAGIVRAVVAIEGPVHRDEVSRRIATLWGKHRLGSRMIDAINPAIDLAVRAQALDEEEGFLAIAGQTEVEVRNREQVQSMDLRKPDLLPPAEVRAALCQVVSRHLGIQRDDAPGASARLFGFRTTSARIREVIERQLDRLVESGQLRLNENRLFIVEGAEVSKCRVRDS